MSNQPATPNAVEWTKEWPHKADAGDVYYWAKKIGSRDVIVAAFSMGHMWVNGITYTPDETAELEFLGPITPADFAELQRLRAACAAAVPQVETLIELMESDLVDDGGLEHSRAVLAQLTSKGVSER